MLLGKLHRGIDSLGEWLFAEPSLLKMLLFMCLWFVMMGTLTVITVLTLAACGRLLVTVGILS